MDRYTNGAYLCAVETYVAYSEDLQLDTHFN